MNCCVEEIATETFIPSIQAFHRVWAKFNELLLIILTL